MEVDSDTAKSTINNLKSKKTKLKREINENLMNEFIQIFEVPPEVIIKLHNSSITTEEKKQETMRMCRVVNTKLGKDGFISILQGKFGSTFFCW